MHTQTDTELLHMSVELQTAGLTEVEIDTGNNREDGGRGKGNLVHR